MNITVVGAGYVGLVTGVSLADIGHCVTCVDVNKDKIAKLKVGLSPIHEPGLESLMLKCIDENRLSFTSSLKEFLKDTDIVYIAVGTPQNNNGTANLNFIETVAEEIAMNISKDIVIVTKSTVPVGTNEYIGELIKAKIPKNISFDIVSNPEFLREGSAISDTFNGDRIVIGAESDKAASIIEQVNKPFGVPIFKTDIRSAEMIKYASNAFLATKISFINEISTICEKLGANVDDVAKGMGKDKRVGNQFLNAGIGYGGSCFPKDTNALVQIAGGVEHDFNLLKAVINVNNNQQALLVDKARQRLGSLEGKRIALLGLAFKPNTDDMREAASIVISDGLLQEGAEVIAYDPIANENAKHVLSDEVQFASSINEALTEANLALIITEWREIIEIDFNNVRRLMIDPIIIDGRNCLSLDMVKDKGIEYHSVGRPAVIGESVLI